MNLPPAQHAVPDEIDFEELCRSVIADPASSALDKFRAMDRLRQIERERGERTLQRADREACVEEAADPERLDKVITLAAEAGVFDHLPGFQARIEQRAAQLVEQQAAAQRAQFGVFEQTSEGEHLP